MSEDIQKITQIRYQKCKSYELEKQEDMERCQRYKLTGHAIPNEAVDAWLGSWGDESELLCPY